VRWVGESQHVHALIAAADVVVLPTTDLHAKVDIPIVLLEAVALGVPVVVASGSSADDLAEVGAALAVPADPGSLRAAIERIVTDTSYASALRAGALAGYRHFRPDVVAAAYEDVYDEVLG
jgi:glycosyltransferase involved in cell wall biosynthesis